MTGVFIWDIWFASGVQMFEGRNWQTKFPHLNVPEMEYIKSPGSEGVGGGFGVHLMSSIADETLNEQIKNETLN